MKSCFLLATMFAFLLVTACGDNATESVPPTGAGPLAPPGGKTDDPTTTCEQVGGACVLDDQNIFTAPDCAALGRVALTGACPAANQACCGASGGPGIEPGPHGDIVSVVAGGELTGEPIAQVFRVRLTDELVDEMEVIPESGLLSMQLICRFQSGEYDMISTLRALEDGTWQTHLEATIRNPDTTGGTDATWSSIDQIVTDVSMGTATPIQSVYFQIFNSAKLDWVVRDRSDSLTPLPALGHIRVVVPEKSSLLDRREGTPHCILTDYFEMEY